MRIFYTELYLFLCYLVFGNTTKYTNIVKSLDKIQIDNTFLKESCNTYNNWYPEISATGGGEQGLAKHMYLVIIPLH